MSWWVGLYKSLELYVLYALGEVLEKDRTTHASTSIPLKVGITVVCFLLFDIPTRGMTFAALTSHANITKDVLWFIRALFGCGVVFGLASLAVDAPELANSKLVREISDRSLGLYLFSDPVNYVVLAAKFNLFGPQIFVATSGAVCIWILRLLLSTRVAWLIAGMTMDTPAQQNIKDKINEEK